MHAPLAPSAACAIYKNKKFEIYSHSQALHDLKGTLVKAFNMKEEDITLIFAPGSGCYGHNGADDAAFDADRGR